MINRTNGFRQILAVEDVFSIRLRLNALVNDHPELSALVGLVPEDCYITSRLMAAYFASPTKSAIKSLVLRAILGDPYLYFEDLIGPVGLPFYRRVAQYLQHHPKRPLDRLTAEFRKEDIQKHLEKVLCIDRSCPRVFLSQLGLIPYLSHRRRQLPLEGYLGIRIKPSDDLSFLKPFYTSRKITQEVCKKLLDERATHNTYATYFDTGDQALDLRNMLFYLCAFWQQDRRGGKLQNKIPRLISDYFGLIRLSIPELAFLVDILPLIHFKVIDLSHLSSKDDHLGIRPVLACVRDCHIEDLEELIVGYSGNWLLTEQKADSMFKIRQEGLREGAYETDFFFNLDRLLTRPTGKRFAHYYKAIDDAALTHQVNSHYQSLFPEFADRLVAIQRRFPHEFTGIRTRDLSNILFYYWHHTQQGREHRGLLPAVAKFALGKTEYEAGLEKQLPRRTTYRGRNQEKSRSEDHLPLLDAFLSTQNKCYLLYPGYQGLMPQDGPIYMPRVIAAGCSELPPDIMLAGAESVTWRQNPYDRVHLPEIEGFDSVVPLRPANR